MENIKLSNYLTLSFAGIISIISSLIYIRLRRKPKMYYAQIKNIPSNINSNEDDEIIEEDLNENNNIGFGNDPTWFRKDSIERNDLLHTGSRGGKLVIVMVGLPGSGKTFMSRKISRFLRWISYRTRVYSLAKYRFQLFLSS